MKKIISLFVLLCVITIASAQQMRNVYVNPVKNNTELEERTLNRLYKKGVLGLTKARTISTTTGDHVMTPGSDESLGYNYILTMTVDKIDATDLVGEAKDAINGVKELFGKKSDSNEKRKPNYTTTIYTKVQIDDAKTGERVYEVDLVNQAADENKNVGYFQATNDFDYTMLDMADDAFKVSGEVVEATDVNKKGEVKKARVKVGSKDGARKDLWFDLYKVQDGNRELLGTAKCEQVLNSDESIISVTGKKGGDKQLNEALSNLDGSYTITAISRAKGGFMRDNFKGFDKIKFKSPRPAYLDPVGRTGKPKIAFMNVECADKSIAGQEKVLQNMILKALDKATALEVVPTLYKSVEDARADGIDGLVEVTLDMVERDTEQTKNSKGETKTKYKSKLYFSVTGIDVANNRWIDMLSKYQLGSADSRDKADADAIEMMDDDIKNFCEDVFPVSCTIMSAEKTNEKKKEVKEASINIGTALGLRKGMIFDIYEQRKEGGDDSRFLIGEGKVKGDKLLANEAIISIKGKNDGDKILFDLIQNMNEDTEIILISKANHGLGGFLDNVLGNN